MKKQILISIALLTAGTFVPPVAKAQDGISNRLEVTREYIPKVGQAEKLPIEPNMTDTVRLRPEISYRITPTPSPTAIATSPFAPATLSTATLASVRPLYVRAGAGGPFQTTADVYFSPHTRQGRTFGLFFNHRGLYSKITNDLDIKANATEMTNGAGLWGSRQLKRYSLEGDLSFDNRLYNPYGVASGYFIPIFGVRQINSFVYNRREDRIVRNRVRGSVSFGDNFTDLSRLNFRLGMDAGFIHTGKWPDQLDLDFRFVVAQMFGDGRHGFEVTLSERGALDLAYGNHAFAVTLAPRYLFSSGVWRLRAGFDARHISNPAIYSRRNYLGFAPSVEARANLAGGAFVPFVSYTSRIGDGSREALSHLNPYIMSSSTGAMAWINDARIGFEGSLGDLFSYKLDGGISLLKDYSLLIAVQQIGIQSGDGTYNAEHSPLLFMPETVSGARFTAGGELGLHIQGGFSTRLYGRWNGYDLNESLTDDLPKFEAGTELAWRHKDKITLTAGARILGEREYLTRYIVVSSSSSEPVFHDETGTLAPAVDISLGAEVKVARNFRVWAEGRNLANRALYPYPHYRGLGRSVMVGVKAVF